jgi:hypothetical protein
MGGLRGVRWHVTYSSRRAVPVWRVLCAAARVVARDSRRRRCAAGAAEEGADAGQAVQDTALGGCGGVHLCERRPSRWERERCV